MVRALAFSTLLLVAACATPPSTPVEAQDTQDTCTPWAAFAAHVPAQARLTEIPEAAAFLERWNAEPPETETTADRVFVAQRGRRIEVFFVTGECLTQHGSIPVEAMARLFGVES